MGDKGGGRKGQVKAEEVNRHLEYLGYEGYASGQPTRPGLLSTRRFPVVMAVLCALILVGMGVYAACPRSSSVVLAQTGQNTQEDVVAVPSPADTDDSFDTLQANGQHFSYKCVGPYYPILAGLLACRGE
jgi:hypothetical protein